MDDVLHDVDVIKSGENLGLFLNCSKCEVICNNDTLRGHIASALLRAMVVNLESACLLGSPLGDVALIGASLEEKIRALSIMGSLFPHLSAHDSLTLLRHSFAIPKLHYLLRTTPCFLSDHLEKYDSTLCSILTSVINTPLLQNDKTWVQATLPVRFGGLGVSQLFNWPLRHTCHHLLQHLIWCLPSCQQHTSYYLFALLMLFFRGGQRVTVNPLLLVLML